MIPKYTWVLYTNPHITQSDYPTNVTIRLIFTYLYFVIYNGIMSLWLNVMIRKFN
jgi:hypothetical protein